MNSSIYREALLEHFHQPHNYGKISNYSHSANKTNRHCGDQIKVYLVIKNNKVEKISFEGKGCVISIATASILTESLKNKDIKFILNFKSAALLKKLQIKLTPTRLKCALLPLEAIQSAIVDK